MKYLHLISKSTANQYQLKKYFTGKPCKRGHFSERYAHGNCVECSIFISLRYYKDNKDHVLSTTREYRETLDKDAVATYQKAYRKANKTKLSIGKKKWAALNPDKTRASSKRSRSTNKGHKNADTALRRTRKLQASPMWADNKAIKLIYKAASMLNLMGFEVHVDHKIPLINNLVCGLHVPGNLQIISAHKNLSKSNKFNIQ